MTQAETTVLGKYRLIAELGSGGMARVYLALALGPVGFQKLVVIKQIQPDLADDHEFVAMFLDEARLAARLNHPNVVQTNEVGCIDGRYFIAMEYLEGQSFRRVLGRLSRAEQGKPPPPLTLAMSLRVVVDALAGLHHAHELTDYDGTPLGVVHRDINPHNIFVTYAGQVKVVDFGIAKAFNSATETRTGVLKGKVAYMSPEQAAGERVDRRADVFSVGMMLWEIAVGQRMFKGMSDVAVLRRLIDRNLERPRAIRPDVPDQLEQIILRAMAPEPDERYSTAAALANELEDFVRELDPRSSTRQVGELTAQRFADDRARVQALIEAQTHSEDQSIDCLPMIDLPLSRASASSGNDSSMTPPSGGRPAPPEDLTVRKQAAELDAVPPSAGPPQSALPTRVEPQGSAPRRIPELQGQPISVTPTHANLALAGQQELPPRSRTWLVVAVGLGLLVSAGGYWLTRDEASAPRETVAAPAPKLVKLRIDSQPPGARVSCAGTLIGATPLSIDLPAGAQPCRYRVELDGFAPYQLEQAPVTNDTTVVANLIAAAPESPAPSATTEEPKTRKPGKTAIVGKPRPPGSVSGPPPPPPSDIRINR